MERVGQKNLMNRIIFITGTGTGVGKTVLTALLLRHFREEGVNALALKPFCSGSRNDARLLQRLQSRFLTLDATNPYFFRQPLSPWVAARKTHAKQVPFRSVLRQIQAVARRAETLLVEGSGGLLAPLGDGYAAAELISGLRCKTIIVAPNSLGTINHVMLTLRHLQAIDVKDIIIVMMGVKNSDYSSGSNVDAIRALTPETLVFSLPFFGTGASNLTNLKQNEKKVKKTLAEIIARDSLCPFLPTGKSDCSTKTVDNGAVRR